MQLSQDLRHHYPFVSRYLDLDGLRYHYLDEGEGKCLVMLHGNPTWSFLYRRLVSSFRHRYRVLAPDHIGCGLSEKPGDDRYSFRLAQRIEDLEKLLLAVQADREPLTLILHDWGGPIGLGWAVRHPKRVARLILLNTAVFLPEGKKLHWTLRFCQRSPLAVSLILRWNLFVKAALRLGCPSRPLSPALRRAYAFPYARPADRLAILRFIQDIPLSPDHPSYATLREVDAGLEKLRDRPALICWGMKDFIFDRDFLKAWKTRLPQAQVRLFPRAGHYALEEEGEEMERSMALFLQESGG